MTNFIDEIRAKMLSIGNVLSGNYFALKENGTVKLHGEATVFNDLNGSVLQLKSQGTGVSINASDNTLEFVTASNLNDYGFDNYQVRHTWKIGSDVSPHFHWEQKEDNTPNLLIQYRWQRQGKAKTTDWTNYPCTTNVFEYVDGTLNQISHGGGITPPAESGLSDVIEFRILRDNANTSGAFSGADTYSQTVGVTFVDIHIEEDSIGSDTQYSK